LINKQNQGNTFAGKIMKKHKFMIQHQSLKQAATYRSKADGIINFQIPQITKN